MDSAEFKNPWNKANIEEFKFFCCTKCEFVTKEDISYQNHIDEKHPESKTFFGGSSKAAQMKCEVKIESGNETGFHCGICGENFAQEKDLASHITHVHESQIKQVW